MTSPQYTDGLTGPSAAVWLTVLRRQKAFAEHAIGHLDDRAFFARPAVIEGTRLNSVAIVVQHLAGNLRSRWTEFLDSDGEKPWRNREEEFAEVTPDAVAPARLMAGWEAGWAIAFATIEALTPEDLRRHVAIRGQPHTVEAAVVRQVDHYAFHIGQIVTIARLFVPDSQWRYFTIPPGGSAAFNRAMEQRTPQ